MTDKQENKKKRSSDLAWLGRVMDSMAAHKTRSPVANCNPVSNFFCITLSRFP